MATLSGLGAGEADRLELEAQLAASQALQRKTHARFEAAQQEAEHAELERRALRTEVGNTHPHPNPHPHPHP